MRQIVRGVHPPERMKPILQNIFTTCLKKLGQNCNNDLFGKNFSLSAKISDDLFYFRSLTLADVYSTNKYLPLKWIFSPLKWL